jgi:uncharacterized integral membrane protein
MRLRTVLLVLAAVAVAVFALLNWDEFTRASTLNLGWQSVDAPLGAVMLVLLGVTALVFIATSVATHTRHMMELRQHQRALQAQRELAERAEASRFTDLRTQLDSHLRESRQRDLQAASEMEQTVARIQRELRHQLEQLHRALGVRLGEMEARLEARIDRPAMADTDASGRPRIAAQLVPESAPAQPAMPGGASRAQRLADEPAAPREEPPEAASSSLPPDEAAFEAPPGERFR